MNLNINKLLNKKGWTGAEVGKLLMASILNDIQHSGEPDHKPLFTQADYVRMATNLRSERDIVVLRAYITLQESILYLYTKAQVLHQQIWHGYYRYVNVIQNCKIATEEQRIKEECIPLVLTQRQYDQTKAAVKAELLQKKESMFSLIHTCLSNIILCEKEMPEEIADILDELDNQTITLSGELLERFNRRFTPDYYTLPDGRRSDQMTEEEWQAAKDALFLEQHPLIIDGKPATLREAKKHYHEEKKKLYVKAFFSGAGAVRELYNQLTGATLDAYEDADILDAWARAISKTHGRSCNTGNLALRNAIDDAIAEPPRVTPHFNIQTEATKLEVLSNCLGYYEEPKLFKKDYPTLYAALETYIKESVPAMRNLKPQQYRKECVTWGELAELEFEYYHDIVEPNPEDIKEKITGIPPYGFCLDSIAIIQNNDRESYEEPESLLKAFSIDALCEDDPATLEWREILKGSVHLMEEAYRHLYAFNVLMDMLGDIYGADNMEALKGDILEETENRIGYLNEMTCDLFAQLQAAEHEEKLRKQAKMLQVYPGIDCSKWQPSQEAIDEIREELEEIGTGREAQDKLSVLNLESMIAKLAERR